ncbi:MAG: sensor histidine kinase [Herminiimonas sp.]|nr:sensor histidine kinase [Herminiimonas sp.]
MGSDIAWKAVTTAVNTLKQKLLVLLLPPLTVLLCGELWLSYRELLIAANSAYDRSLGGAIKAIDAGISTASGGLGMDLPYTVLEFFELTASGRVFYRISTEDGLVSLGNADLPAPPVELKLNIPSFYDAQYFGESVRVGAYTRLLDKPLYGVQAQRVIILVAETRESRTTFANGLLKQAVLMDGLLVLMIALLMAAGVVLALRPLHRLRHEIVNRAQDDLTPIDPARVPLEVRPLVDAINQHIERYDFLARDQRQFLDDASHQLRTPLSVLRTQVDYALREPEHAKVVEALGAMQRGVDRAVRLVNQLLALARVNSMVALIETNEKIDINSLAEDVARTQLPEARRKGQDFGFATAGRIIMVSGIETLLREALTNLLENAIRYVPGGGHITLSIDADASVAQVTISDNGPGMPDDEKGRIGERFRRGKAATGAGAGLGLAIAKTIIEQHQGKLEVTDGPDGVGLKVCLFLPLHIEQNRTPY